MLKPVQHDSRDVTKKGWNFRSTPDYIQRLSTGT